MIEVVWMALWPRASTESVRQRTVSCCISEYSAHRSNNTLQHRSTPPPRSKNMMKTYSATFMNQVTVTRACGPLTFAVRFEIPVDGRGLAVVEHGPARRRLGTGAEAHVGGRGDLFPQGGELHGARRHGHIVGFVHRLRQTARVVVRRRVGTHGYVVLVYLLCGLAANRHHSFIFLRGDTAQICSQTKASIIAGNGSNIQLYFYTKKLSSAHTQTLKTIFVFNIVSDKSIVRNLKRL